MPASEEICLTFTLTSTLTADFFSSTVKILRGRELTGAQCFSSICPVSNYERMRLHRRILGHLSAVYCIAFDRTGLRIFTVSSNMSKCPRPTQTNNFNFLFASFVTLCLGFMVFVYVSSGLGRLFGEDLVFV